MSLIAPATAAAQLGAGVDVPDGAFSAVTYVLGWFAGTLALLGLAALAAWLVPPHHAERVYETAHRETGRSVIVGVLMMIGIPLTVLALAVTVVGIPLAIATSVLGSVLSTAGYVISGWLLGRAISERRGRPVDVRGRVMWALIGVGILRVVALVPVLDVVVMAVACTFGVGALLATYAPPIGDRLTSARRRRPTGEDVVEAPMIRVFDAREA